ncbi:MAG: hypothetical protein RIS70_2610 [Planctomycetota bacterium]
MPGRLPSQSTAAEYRITRYGLRLLGMKMLTAGINHFLLVEQAA